uniref:Rod shape-determining protein MreD n=1 Tax=Drosophila melanogaster TaxID=7227 RepID=M9PBV9_DROME|nr:uncharacterized protein Dmel_CG43886 [Drosophila melanogaster]AGB94257.1 uncharacterized protein Dmel_CG43886 [Drosophila melanogaster]|eukprot:NP_001261562.1 uncharacterized protein Dmel_CG43886 [Drosophila melanogaster]
MIFYMLAIDMILYFTLLSEFPIWAFLLFKLVFINRPLERIGVILLNTVANWYIFPYLKEWIDQSEAKLNSE